MQTGEGGTMSMQTFAYNFFLIEHPVHKIRFLVILRKSSFFTKATLKQNELFHKNFTAILTKKKIKLKTPT